MCTRTWMPKPQRIKSLTVVKMFSSSTGISYQKMDLGVMLFQ